MEKRKSSIWIAVLAISMMALVVIAGGCLVREVVKNGIPGASTERQYEAGDANKILSDKTVEKLINLRQVLDEGYLFGTEGTDFDTAVIRAYVDALGDPYTVYFTPDEYDDLMESSEGSYCGIGVSVQQDPKTMTITVVRVFHGSPAEEAGMKSGDILYAIGGAELNGMDINLAVTQIRGEVNTPVEITVYRPSSGEYIDLDMTRRIVEVDSVDGKMLEGDIGYIELMSFDEPTYQQFLTYFNSLRASGAKGFIFDLRDNGGGLLSSVANILDALLPEGIITYTIDKNGKRQDYRSNAYTILEVPVVILTNGNTASASEIFTGALKDYGLATSVGTTTFGKGIVQMIMPLDDGDAIKVTVSRYYTPNGVCIHGEGIAPDVEVEDDAATEVDEQLTKAIEELRKKMN